MPLRYLGAESTRTLVIFEGQLRVRLLIGSEGHNCNFGLGYWGFVRRTTVHVWKVPAYEKEDEQHD